METLEDRLRSRFESGLTVDIQIPTYETSMAILDRKIEAEGYDVPFEVKDFIVNNINSNIRELEGALNKVTAYSKVAKTEITLDLAKKLLKDLISPNAHREVTIEYIIQIVADHFGITIADIISAKRKAEIVYPRQIAMYLCRKCTDEPLASIGKYMGDRDHTTVIHGAEKIEKELSSNENTKNVIDVLIKKINPQ
jgi:chromosomal replication initiator protein